MSQKITKIQKIRKIGHNYGIVIPVKFIENNNIKIGDKVKLEYINNNTINIKILTDSYKNSNIIENQLLPENIFKSFTIDKKMCYSLHEIQKRTKLSIEEIEETLKNLKQKGYISSELIKIGTQRTITECFYMRK